MPTSRQFPYFVNLQGGFSGFNNPGAQTWYVAVSGWTAVNGGLTPSDSNSGTHPQRPFATIQKGLDACVAARGDIVAVLPGTYTLTAPLTMTKANVTLCSAFPVGPREYSQVIITAAATYDNNLVQLDASYTQLIGLAFQCGFTTVTANQEVVQINSVNDATDIWGCNVINCTFDGSRSAGAANAADADLDFLRIGLDSSDRAYRPLVQGCTFFACDQDAIAIPSASALGATIRNCNIYDGAASELTRYGVSAAGVHTLVEDCDITVADTATPGAGIYVNSTLVRAAGNRIWARGADTLAILVAASATLSGLGNVLTAVAAGNLTDYTTDNTSPSADCNFKGIFAATPGAAAFETPTIGGL